RSSLTVQSHAPTAFYPLSLHDALPIFDSLTFNGKVIMAETGKVDSRLIVMLHITPDDSALVKERPRYVAKLNGNGEFTFRNLPKSEEHTSELQSRENLVCRLLLEKKKK